MVADPDVVEARLVGGAGDLGELVGSRTQLPVGGEQRALRLDRQLDAVDDSAFGNGLQRGPLGSIVN